MCAFAHTRASGVARAAASSALRFLTSYPAPLFPLLHKRSDYPAETLPTPEEAGAEPGRLSPWQEAHARLVLERAPQLRDLRFVLCPRRLDDFQFWLTYFTLCRRYLPREAFDPAAAAAASAAAAGGSGAAAAGAAGAAAAAAAAGGAERSRHGSGGVGGGGGGPAHGGSDTDGAHSDGGSEGGGGGEGGGAAALAELEADPELDAYLQEALAVGDGASDGHGDGHTGGGSDEGDLDDYINQLEGGGGK